MFGAFLGTCHIAVTLISDLPLLPVVRPRNILDFKDPFLVELCFFTTIFLVQQKSTTPIPCGTLRCGGRERCHSKQQWKDGRHETSTCCTKKKIASSAETTGRSPLYHMPAKKCSSEQLRTVSLTTAPAYGQRHGVGSTPHDRESTCYL